MNTKVFEEIGLTPGEIKVYMALLKIGKSSTGAIAKESQVSRSKLYIILDKLAKKGLVGHLMKDGVAYFNAMGPKRIIDYIEEKNRELSRQKKFIQKMLPELELRQRLGKSEAEAALYEGFKAIKNFYLNILDELRSGETYYVISAAYGENRLGVKEFFENYHKQRAKKKIKVRMLANYNAKKMLAESTFMNSEIRFLPQYLISNMIIVFYKTKSFIFFLSDEPIGLFIENEEVTKGFKSYFDAFWKIAKK